jgi:apolipoprotein N-acyltransferase
MRATAQMQKTMSIRLAEDFLCAGSSVLLIACAQLHPELWFVALFALVPFMWRTVKVGLGRSLVLGAFLATAYSFVAWPIMSWVSPGAFLTKLASLNILFALYAVAVNRIKRYVGFNAVFIAALWLPLEYILSHYTHLGSMFGFTTTDSGLVYRVSSLFGVLMISFVVVLVNTLILIFLKRVVEVLCSKAAFSVKIDKQTFTFFKEILFETRGCYFTSPRAPPFFA